MNEADIPTTVTKFYPLKRGMVLKGPHRLVIAQMDGDVPTAFLRCINQIGMVYGNQLRAEAGYGDRNLDTAWVMPHNEVAHYFAELLQSSGNWRVVAVVTVIAPPETAEE